MFMLIFAYVVLFLPQAVGAVRTSLLQVSPNVEHAASSLGLSPWQVMRRVTIPLVRPGIVTGATLVFLTVMKELPATLLLSPLGFRTLAVQIWGAVTEAYYIEAAAPSLLLMAGVVGVGGNIVRVSCGSGGVGRRVRSPLPLRWRLLRLSC